jgi:Alpha/beta hydrolase
MQLRYISKPALIAAAGGDPWAINQSLQAGSPSQISDLAQAFHQAGRCTAEADNTFEQARNRFDAAWNHQNGDHPINDSAEVQRVTKSLGAQSLQIPKIGADLENIAATLAEAQKAAAGQIAALEGQLQGLDDLIGQAVEMEKDVHLSAADRDALNAFITGREDEAIRDTKAAVGQLESTRDGYSATFQNSLTSLRADGYDPASIQAVDGPQSEVPALPDDPQQFAEAWNALTPEQKDAEYHQNPFIGNHPGMPWDPPDHLGKDHYNQLHLSELEQHTQADVDRMQHRVDELAAKVYMGDHSQATADELNALTPQLLAARHTLQGYQTVQATLNRNDGVKRYLGLIDDNGHAAVAIGNPDYAKRNALFVPGTGQDLPTFQGSDLKSLRMYYAAMNANPDLRPGDVAVTTWMGYDRPMNLFEAASPDRARDGAAALDSFESGLRASHVGGPSIDTVIGHSYGSTEVGAAATGGHHLDANNVIAVGSPGMLSHHASDLSLDPGATIYGMRAHNDIIEVVTDLTLGHDPAAADHGGTRLLAAPGPSSDPIGLTPSVAAHSSYWSEGNPGLLNMGAVIAGVPPPDVIPNDGEH